jgi:hypothetical protein
MPREKNKDKSKAVVTRAARDANHQAQIIARRKARGNVEAFDWRVVEPSLLLRVVVATTREGFTCQFGYTKDGGAGVIRMWADGIEPDVLVIRPSEDCDLALEGIISDYGGD